MSVGHWCALKLPNAYSITHFRFQHLTAKVAYRRSHSRCEKRLTAIFFLLDLMLKFVLHTLVKGTDVPVNRIAATYFAEHVLRGQLSLIQFSHTQGKRYAFESMWADFGIRNPLTWFDINYVMHISDLMMDQVC